MSRNLSLQAVAPSNVAELLIKTAYPSFYKATLNRPQVLNALNLELLKTLKQNADIWQNDPDTHIVLFDGAGDRAFSAGGDVKRFLNAYKSGDKTYLPKFFKAVNETCYELAVLRPHQISFWNGIVMGAGVGISVNSKIRIATEKTKLGLPEIKIGLWADVGAGFFLSRLRGNIGCYLGVTGHILNGHEAVQAGLADFYVKSENLKLIESRLVQLAPKNPTIAELREVVKKYSESMDLHLKEEEKISKYFSKDNLDEIYKHLKEDEKVSQFARQTLKELEDGSPLCEKLTFEQIKRGRRFNMKENFALDLKVNQRLANHNDLYEGSRCLLIDKNEKPKWAHGHLFEVSKEEVAKYLD